MPPRTWALVLLFASAAALIESNNTAKRGKISYFGFPASTTDERRLNTFFKIAHSRMDNGGDLRAQATGLFSLYNQLCSAVDECESAVAEMYRARFNELQFEVDRMDRLKLVLSRLARMRARHKPGPSAITHAQ